METRTAHLDVTGMTCANCSGTVGDAFESLDGVIEANANFATDEGSVEYDPDEVSLAEICETIEDAGYGAVSDTVTIGISDMTCANCVQTNETALEDTPGVIAAERTSPPTKRRSGTTRGHVTRRALRRYRGRWLLAGP